MNSVFSLMLGHLRWIVIRVAILWGGMVNLFLLGNLLTHNRFSPVIVLNFIAHWITLIALLAFALAFALKASRKTLLWLGPGAAAFVWWYAPAWLPHAAPEVRGTEFTAATYNVLGYLADPDQTFAVIQAMDADIVGLQELRPALEAKLKTELADEYPYQVSKVVQGFDGYALLSRFPIVESDMHLDIDWDHITFDTPRYLRAVLDIQGQQVVVYVFHSPIPQPSPYTHPPYQILFQYDDSYQKKQVTSLEQRLKTETLPVLLLCDCNSTPRSRVYATFDALLDDAFGAQGWGLGLTTPSHPFPLIRIDYIWYSEEFVALDAKVWPEAGTSDHYPVWGRLVLR